MGLNKWMGIGNSGADPEVKYLESGGKVASFRLAVSETYKDRNGERKENTEWINLSVFGKTAEFVENYVRKGSQLFVEGKLRTRLYKDKSGVEKSVTEILVDNLQLLGSRQAADRNDTPAQKPATPAPAPKPSPANDFEPTDDLPFSY